MSQGVRITENFAMRIASTVRRVDAMSPVTGDGKIPTRFEEGPAWATPASGVFEAYFTGGWVKGATKQISFASNTATTAAAINLIRSVPISGSGATARICTVTLRSIASTTGPAYVLLNTEC
jgi:hypothetical protein